jgi:hypothetical protein
VWWLIVLAREELRQLPTARDRATDRRQQRSAFEGDA